MNHIIRIAIAAILCGALVSSPVLADTVWTAGSTSVSDLLTPGNWDNGAPVTADNPGFITGQTITVSNDFYPGAEGQDIDITFNGATSTTFSKGFVPLKNLPNNKAATFTMRLQDTANVYVTNNFWGGNNNTGQSYDQSGKDYLIYQYYGGNSTFSCNEWWTAMTARTYIEISDNATVTARGGTNSGLGWDNAAPYTADGSRLEMSGKGKLTVSSTNLNFWGEGTTVNMRGSSSISAIAISISRDAPQVNLYDNAKITASEAVNVANQATVSLNDNANITLSKTLKLDNKSSLTLNNNASLTVTSDCALDRNGRMDVNDNANVAFKAALKIGDINAGDAGGAVFNLSGGTVTVSGTTYFSYHSDATVNLSGGKFISNSNQLYATDQKGKTVDITMTNDGYLQAKDLRLSQHGHTNLTMKGNSLISVTDLNMAYNYDPGDNVVNVVTMGGSSNITASNNMYFFGNNVNGAAYGSLTLNDSASVVIANEVQVGKGSTTSLIDGKSYAAEITLNGSSKFSTITFTTTPGATSATTVNGSAIFEAETINLAANSILNVNGGSINVESLNNAGTVNLAGGAINLTPYGLITSTAGTFNATGGTVNVQGSDKVSYTTGDQLLVGLFADQTTAAAVAGNTTVPEGWQTAVLQMGDSQAVVASYGDEVPTGVKIWVAGNSGSMADSANWTGDASNPTGFVLDGTNTMSNITGKTIVMGGTNTFNGDMPAGTAFAFNDGTSYMKGTNYYGSIIVNDGTVDFTGGDRLLMDNAGYMEVNGGEVKITDKWFKSYQDIVVNDGKVNFTGNGLAMKTNSVTTNNGGAVTLSRIIIGDDNAPDGYAASENPSGDFTSKYINNAGTTTINGLVEVAQKNNTIGYFEVNGGSVTTSGDFEVAVGTNSKAFLTVAGDDTSFSTKKLYLGHNSSAEYQQTSGTVTVSDTTYFSYHGNVKVDISGGKFYANGGQLYVTDQKDRTADITMTGDAYLQAKDLRLSQHGKTNLTMSGDSTLKVNTLNLAYNYGNGDNVETTITMSGESRLETGEIRSFGGNTEKTHNGAAYVSITMTDNAYLYATGNTWGGYNNASYGPGALSGKDYNLEMTFKDNSYFSTGEFWMAMTAKSHVTIEGNATVIARSGYSGMGWCNKAAGSLLEIKGGTFQVDSTWFAIGCRNNTDTINTGVCNVIQTGGQATYKMILLGNNASKYEISGENPVMTTDNVTTLTGSTLKISGGTVNIGTLDNGGTLDLSGGTLNVGEGGISASGSYAVNLSGGVISTNGASWNTTSTVNATVADNSTVTFEPEDDQTIKWTGALVNSSQNATIVKSGNGTLKIDSPDQNNPSKLGSFVVNAGELDFKGYFVGDIEVKNDAVMSPGNSVGTLTVDGDFILNSAAILLIEQDETGIDQLIAKSFNIDDNAVLDLSIGSIQPGQTYEIFFQKDGDTAVDFTDKYATDDFWNSLLSSENAYYWHLSVNGNVVMATLDANAVPEPSTWALLALGAVGLLYWRKRK